MCVCVCVCARARTCVCVRVYGVPVWVCVVAFQFLSRYFLVSIKIVHAEVKQGWACSVLGWVTPEDSWCHRLL